MNYQKKIIVALFVLIFVVAVNVGAACIRENYEAPIERVQTNEGSFSVSYPQLTGFLYKSEKNKINQIIRQEVLGFAGKNNKPENTGQVNYEIQFNKKNIVSLCFTEFLSRSKAAHPMTYLRALTMHIALGEVYHLKDIFISGSDYQNRLTEYVQKQIESQQILLLKPFKTVESEQEFYLSNDGLVVFWQLYEYTPYVYGFLKFTIPYDRIEDILQPELVAAIRTK